jgi:hypothetical protein
VAILRVRKGVFLKEKLAVAIQRPHKNVSFLIK